MPAAARRRGAGRHEGATAPGIDRPRRGPPGAAPGADTTRRPPGQAGFTLTELLVVLAVVGLLAAIAVPSVEGVVRRAEEAALRENLSVMRRALDDHYADTGAYPPDLATLVERRYIRFVPEDPVAPEDSGWDVVAREEGGVTDLRSTVTEPGSDGRPYSEW